MTEAQTLAGQQLRASGMRSTPQRRAILAAFQGGDAEHLSADEVYARAAASLPDLGRGTVYATLAEFTENGLLAAFGTPEPVRYEINTARHAHFRCRLCARIFDVDGDTPDPSSFESHGFKVENLDLRAEGICRECQDFEAGVEAGVRAITELGASGPLKDRIAAAIQVDTPVGPLLVAATANGVARVAFPEHGDVDYLRGLIGADTTPEITAHLEAAAEQLNRYFANQPALFDATIDWDVVGFTDELRATMAIPYGATRSYHLLKSEHGPRDLGHAFGANPIAIIAPCHRVTRGGTIPEVFVGGESRRVWLLDHERQTLES